MLSWPIQDVPLGFCHSSAMPQYMLALDFPHGFALSAVDIRGLFREERSEDVAEDHSARYYRSLR